MSDMTGFRSFNSVTCNRENIIARRHTRSVWNSTVYVVQIKNMGAVTQYQPRVWNVFHARSRLLNFPLSSALKT